MESGNQRPLGGWDVHGFHTLEELDIKKMKEEAVTRWLRPNEIHAILCNHKYFNINVKPVELPESGTIILYDRKMLRNFRKDGYNWKKKKDGKTVKEAHEHLKVGNMDRIHVYYAHGLDKPNFVRRIYWLLDKNLEHIVLVHYREISEENAVSYHTTPKECKEALSLSNRMHYGSPVTPVHSNSGSFQSETSGSKVISEEINSGMDQAFCTGSSTTVFGESTDFRSQLGENLVMTDLERRLLEINTLDWADLLEPNNNPGSEEPRNGENSCLTQQRQSPYGHSDSESYDNLFACQRPSSHGNSTSFINDSGTLSAEQQSNAYFQPAVVQGPQSSLYQTIDTNSVGRAFETTTAIAGNMNLLDDNPLQSQDSFSKWIDIMGSNSPGPLDELAFECPIPADNNLSSTLVKDQSPFEEVFCITEVSPSWAWSTEQTKVIVIGYFREGHAHLAQSSIYCVFGDVCVPVEMVQTGVYRCMVSPRRPGSVDFYLTFNGCRPISQVLSFEYRLVSTNQMDNEMGSSEDDKSKWGDLQLQIRLAYLLFSTTCGIATLFSKVPPNVLKEAKRFTTLMPSMEKDWMSFMKLIMNKEVAFSQVNHNFVEVILKNKLEEWLLESILEGRKTTPRDSQGQGVIHLCAMLGYTWAVKPFSLSGLSLDFRDAHGWTALHWAAYHGREKMVVNLLVAGANPSLVTDPTPECPGGYTAADLASMKGHDGLAAYLAEEGLQAHFNAMCLSGNIKDSMQTTSRTTIEQSGILSEEEQLMRDSLAAYRHAADAASRIQTAMREHALQVRTKLVQSENLEIEARNIISAMKIQHAYRNYNSRKRMAAAVHIQHKFRAWKIRKDFLNKRRQAIKIQAAFRGHLVRRQYRKILWSVGVLEKAILRWRLKRKGLRGLQVEPSISSEAGGEKEDAEEDFYKMSRKQAEERVERSVVRVQAMFRSHQAQKEYRRMKLAFDEAKLEYGQVDKVDHLQGAGARQA